MSDLPKTLFDTAQEMVQLADEAGEEGETLTQLFASHSSHAYRIAAAQMGALERIIELLEERNSRDGNGEAS